MVRMTKFTTLVAVTSIALVAGIADASAKKRHHHESAAEEAAEHASEHACKSVLEGRATGQGLFGKGTAEARAAARFDWESKSTNKYGYEYGNFDKAKGAHFDCNKLAILHAKCVVTARPCHQ